MFPISSRFLALFLATFLLFARTAPAATAFSPNEEFSWQQCAGQSILVMLNQHPYAEMIIRKLDAFEALTGIKVAYVMIPEGDYFPRLDESFNAAAGKPDVFMTGAYQVWEYAPKGLLAELDPFITNPTKTRSNYAYRDFFSGIAGSFRWSGIAGEKTGEGNLWAVPLGFEANGLTYNREVLANYRIMPPRSLEEMIGIGRQLRGFGGEGTYGVTVRGENDWGTLHSGYMTAFVNYGAQDVVVENGRLVSKVNSPEAVRMTELWLEMLQEAGPEDWRNYNWYRASDDLGSRKAAILFDADILGFFQNAPGASDQAGKLASAPPPMPPDSDPADVLSNLWVWGVALNAASESKDAAWLFIAYFTSKEFQLYSVLEGKSINPPRRSVFESPAFQRKIASMEGFAQTFSRVVEGTSIYFTPTPHFFEIAHKWVGTLHDIADGKYESTQEGMDALKEWMDERLADVVVE
jgi:ABC-type sugar transport system, periplasmic component